MSYCSECYPNQKRRTEVVYCLKQSLTWPNNAYPSAQLGNLRMVDSKAFINESVLGELPSIVARRKSISWKNNNRTDWMKTGTDELKIGQYASLMA